MLQSDLRQERVGIYYRPGWVADRVSIENMILVDTPTFEFCRRPVNDSRNLRTILKYYSRATGDINERCTQLRMRPMGVHDAIVADGFAYYVQPCGELSLVSHYYGTDRVWICPRCAEAVRLANRDAADVENLVELHESGIHNIMAR